MEWNQEFALLLSLSIASTALLTTLLMRYYWLQQRKTWLVERDILLKDQKELHSTRSLYQEEQLTHTRLQSEHAHLRKQLESQKAELTDLHDQLYARFQSLAEQVLEQKAEKFSAENSKQIKSLLEPLGKEIKTFQEKVNEEAKERFSLANEVKKLAAKNDEMSQVAINLTRALKQDSKAQGRWGEMILESLLERSGLVKGTQYLMEHQLLENGESLRSATSGKKMRPDAVINYPDERTVIVDSKVSLTAFERSLGAEDEEHRQAELHSHLLSVKQHIKTLSDKAYDDYRKSMDFILMFIPSEPAYIAAMQADPELWHYAYERRILLQSPSNLIASLKLIEELWKREQHNLHAQEIAERGAKLYDKFVGFVENLEDVGKHLDKAKERYEAGYKQLATGPGNLVRQADQLKSMVGKTKKELPDRLTSLASDPIS